MFHFLRKADKARNYTQCDSLLVGNKCGAHTIPYIDSKNNSAIVEHEASTSKINEDQLYYCRQRGLNHEEAVSLIVNGFCKQVLQELPMEFAVEAQKLSINFFGRKCWMIFLNINNLNVSIEGKKILNDFNLTINQGEVHAIMGPNGCW